MADFLLIASTLAMFVLGWFLIKRLDCSLEKHRKDIQAEKDESSPACVALENKDSKKERLK